jgi:hypothetical protein
VLRCDDLSSKTAIDVVVYPDSEMIQLFTSDGEDDVVVKQSKRSENRTQLAKENEV